MRSLQNGTVAVALYDYYNNGWGGGTFSGSKPPLSPHSNTGMSVAFSDVGFASTCWVEVFDGFLQRTMGIFQGNYTDTINKPGSCGTVLLLLSIVSC